MADERTFYVVTTDLSRAPLRDHLMHGYESRWEFEKALLKLAKEWKDRVGEAVTERHDFIRLRFHDTPGGLPDEEWMPRYLLLPAPMPEYLEEHEPTKEEEMERELDRCFGFD